MQHELNITQNKLSSQVAQRPTRTTKLINTWACLAKNCRNSNVMNDV